MRFHTCVGVLPHEERVAQPLELDLSVWLSLKVGPTLDYRDLYRLVAEVVGSGPHRLLEGLCERIADRALDMDGVDRVRVAARKPQAPMDGPLDYVEVVMERTRDRAG